MTSNHIFQDFGLEKSRERRMTEGNRREDILGLSSFHHHHHHHHHHVSVVLFQSLVKLLQGSCVSPELKWILQMLIRTQKAPSVLRFYERIFWVF